MPLPTPRPKESEQNFVSRFMGNDKVIKEFPDEKQRLAVAHSKFKTSKKMKERICIKGLKLKEDGHYTALAATTHPDRVGDILSVHSLHQMKDYINDKSTVGSQDGSYRAVSLFHDWVHAQDPTLDEAGFIVGQAEVIELDDGHYGLEVDVDVNKYYSGTYDGKQYDADRVTYEIDKGKIGGLSIEYNTDDRHCHPVEHNGQEFRFIDELTDFAGVGFARSRMIANPAAVIYKEIESKAKTKIKEEKSMAEEEKPVENVEAPKEEATPEPEAKVEEKPVVEEKPAEEKPVAEEKAPEPEAKEIKPELSVKEIVESKEFKDALAKEKVESKTRINKEENTMNITVKEMKESLDKDNLTAYKEAAGRYCAETNLFQKAIADPSNYTQGFKSNLRVKCVGKGLKIMGGLQVKGTLDTDSNTSSYTQDSVEFADVFAPGIIDTFNNQTNLFGFLKKEQHIGGSYYQWKMVTNKDPESNSTFVGQNDVTITKNFADKRNYQTPLKIARRGISVTDFINRYSASSLGDLFALEVELQMTEMMNDVNAALFAEVADGTNTSPLGLEAVADSAGNTTLYGKTRSTANRLAPDSASDTYLAVGGSLTEAALRAKIKQLEVEGTRFGDIAIIASPNSRDLLFNLLDGNRRFMSTEAAFGFNKANVPSYDGFPVIVDADCNSDAIYVIDTSNQGDVIVIGMAPTMTNLAKVGAATEAYVQMDFAHVYKQPRRIGMLDTLS